MRAVLARHKGGVDEFAPARAGNSARVSRAGDPGCRADGEDNSGNEMLKVATKGSPDEGGDGLERLRRTSMRSTLPPKSRDGADADRHRGKRG
jgi:hypothetical protein